MNHESIQSLYKSRKIKPHADTCHISIYLPFRKMISCRSVVTASKDIWEPQISGKVGVVGLLSGAFGGDPEGEILETLHQIVEILRFPHLAFFFFIMQIWLSSWWNLWKIISPLLTFFFKAMDFTHHKLIECHLYHLERGEIHWGWCRHNWGTWVLSDH